MVDVSSRVVWWCHPVCDTLELPTTAQQNSLTFCPQFDLVADYCDYPDDVSLIFIQITPGFVLTQVTDNTYGVNIKTSEEAKNIWIYQL